MEFADFLGFCGNFLCCREFEEEYKEYISIDSIKYIYAKEDIYTEIRFYLGKGWRSIKFEIHLNEFMKKLSAHQNSPTLILKEINQKLDSIDQRLNKLEIDIDYAPGNDKSFEAKEHFEDTIKGKK